MKSNGQKNIKVSENSRSTERPKIEIEVFENEKPKYKGQRT